ncbi:MAG: saccharopine dehydrogenase NADP-binding domain-containing protein [Hoeflea sp.]|uniref:saccharopine dehydrogenase family protein n=1 Tax=Hoeflea sp. TaxID=1940281 RepID=UPI001D1D3674|nr:saccharopine dehydrogenase C-terminal domain-containing protein [Hoeflea sp.]MBU4531943.1 saccharopine dehydrogenase NADP-binding domain-containing protein [Alphaproteobacteria bacterium]MBU4546365.1 saccharopine dehydrogenase NADP-binding domain-containing protein [Alphaproteobacteria bacterium]MBU4549494.1 saccharopine dehydrogenase NADP-binding domain-containing protein [Alphaproteobacteria bacterium]MBV1722669.1 saccharopine dehydrogenase NADP-binding domain-containing protein [Hoeflea s
MGKKLKVTIVGAGNIGTALAVTLAQSEEFCVQVIDRSEDALDRLRSLNLTADLRNISHADDLQKSLSNQDVVVAAVPARALDEIAQAAARANIHYLDFTGMTPQSMEMLAPLAAQRAVFKGCGVSPGLITNVAYGLAINYAPVSDLIIRVGAIPRYPSNRLGYGQIWNVDGLIDEYTLPSTAIRNGQQTSLSPLEEYGQLMIDGVAYEEFITSGGIEDLSVFSGLARNTVTFKTIRYPGHLNYIRFLLDDLGLRNRRDMLRSLLYNALPVIEDDVLILAVTVRGNRGHQPTERTVCHRFSPNKTVGPFNALTSVATAYAASLLSMLNREEIEARGFVPHHKVDVETLLGGAFLRPLIG